MSVLYLGWATGRKTQVLLFVGATLTSGVTGVIPHPFAWLPHRLAGHSLNPH